MDRDPTAAPPGNPADPAPLRLATAPTLRRGLRKRCPLCAGKGLFRSWLRFADRCPTCGFGLARTDGQWSGDIGLNTIVSFTALFLTILVGALTGVPIPALAAVAAVVAIGLPLGFASRSKTTWLAIDVLLRPPEADELDAVDPAVVAAAPRRP